MLLKVYVKVYKNAKKGSQVSEEVARERDSDGPLENKIEGPLREVNIELMGDYVSIQSTGFDDDIVIKCNVICYSK